MKKQKLNRQTLFLLLLALSFTLFTGMKCKKENNSVNNQLPPITQEGKNTFGFLLNGEVWLPKAPILKSKLDLSYDPTYNGGALGISAKRILSENNQMYLSIGGININKPGTYNFEPPFKNVSYSDDVCYYTDGAKISGSITITKLDLKGNGIISGTFNFKLEKEGCPTINATEGRFDLSIQ
ncbi:DUF6252 family protein [Pedobacter arcticus]|uniref:DUF6252 family protein n=1 Tax=Pedobacter arcticus TaxID=752140 RepID=UPI0002EF972B|nr:DUF6252 family protein [Pedobacter arcticus]